MTPRNNECYPSGGILPWTSNPSDIDSSSLLHDMAFRRGSMQHVPFMDFSFFPIPEAAAATATAATEMRRLSMDTSSAPSSTTMMMMMSAANQNQQRLAFHQYQQQQQMQQIQMQQGSSSSLFECDDRSSVSNPSSEPSVATASLDSSSSDHSLISSSESFEGQRFKPFHEEKWTHRYKELLEFRRAFGHSAVPHTYPKNPQLARWIKRQRRQFKLRNEGKPSTMTAERLDLLNSVGFIWDSHDLNWREKLEALTAFRAEMGHCNVPSNFGDKKLSTWVKCQRRQYKLYWDGKPSAMSLDRIASLEKVGFEWEIRSAGAKATKPASGVSSEEDPLPVHVPSSVEQGRQLASLFLL